MENSPTLLIDSGDLIARARDGDQDAWSELFEECYPKILRVIRRRMSRQMRKHLDSTDIANDVMNSLATRFGDFDFASVNELRKFVLHAAQQKVIDHHRHQHAQRRNIDRDRSFVTDDGRTQWEPADDSPTPSQIAVASEEEQQLLEKQSGPARAVLELRLQGYSKPEVAREVGWSVRTVERLLKKVSDSWRL
ncbi:RNA polymerase sigma factor [Tundrisphaera sp. TA3]|uniref:RNA polymerase sigma factor n=1 Tax=Tundrisphaera sp. TA3 TaxID=3435775 RepID=UPI003EC07A8B